MRKIIGIVLAALIFTSCSVEDECSFTEPVITVFEGEQSYFEDSWQYEFVEEIDTKTLVKMYNNDTDKVKSICRERADKARAEPTTIWATKIDFGKDIVYVTCQYVMSAGLDHHIWLYKRIK